MSSIPYLKRDGNHTRLYVGGKPFTAFGGELHNSSASSLEYMESAVWPNLRPLGMNTVILPVYWECVEPKQGAFDFALVDGIIKQAGREGMKLILLWFGLWKNGMSTYVPGWVKLDNDRYYYVRDKYGKPIPCISPICGEAVEADAAAFGALMKHLKEVDGGKNTVIMVQIENEMGVLGASRDFSDRANGLFEAPIPENVAEQYGKNGTWTAFGEDANELFMAYHYSCAVERIIQRGKEQYPLPMFVNAWLEQFPGTVGLDYPMGGPVARVAHMWRLCAPSVELYAPDIYVEHYRDVCDEYAAVENNPLCIPEVRASVDSVSFLLYAVGRHNAICFSPFGIEDLFQQNAEGMGGDVLGLLNISQSAMSHSPQVGMALAHAYKTLGNMTEVIDRAHDEGRINAFLEYHEKGAIFHYKNYEIRVRYNSSGSAFAPAAQKKESVPKAGGFIIELGDSEFIFAGVECSFEIVSKSSEPVIISYLQKQEGFFENNVWKPGRILNGDERHRSRFGDMLTMQKVCLHDLK